MVGLEMTRFKSLPVECECGLLVAVYLKGGSGRLRKMYFGRIKEDPHGLFTNEPPLSLQTDILCPECKKRIGTVARVSGHAAVKINQGVIRT
jgi:hypothetical protein